MDGETKSRKPTFGMNMHSLAPVDEDAKLFKRVYHSVPSFLYSIDKWYQEGVYDALEKKYVRCCGIPSFDTNL